jgi:hypothetical protein
MNNNFNSSLKEEILALIETVEWLNKFEGEFNIPAHYKKYLANLAKRLEDLEILSTKRI